MLRACGAAVAVLCVFALAPFDLVDLAFLVFAFEATLLGDVSLC